MLTSGLCTQTLSQTWVEGFVEEDNEHAVLLRLTSGGSNLEFICTTFKSAKKKKICGRFVIG